MAAPVVEMSSFATRERSREDAVSRTDTRRGRNAKALQQAVDIKFIKGRIHDMERERSDYLPHWRDIGDFMLPRHSHHLYKKRGDGRKRNDKILNDRATKAIRRAVAGFQSGMTPRTRPWFIFEPEVFEDDQQDRFEQQEWANGAARVVRSVMQRSNFYQSTQIAYQDFVPYGIGCIQIDEDPGPKVIRCTVHPIGSYVIDTNEEGIVDTWARTRRWTLKQIIGKFGRQALPPQLREQAKKGLGAKHDVTNIIMPNEDYRAGSLGTTGKPFLSVWYLDEYVDKHGPIRVGGYEEFPIFCARTFKTGDQPWPQSLGMDALPSVKQLQAETRLKLEALEKKVWPPMKGPASVAQAGPSQLPGSYEAVANQAEALTPQYLVDFDLTAAFQDIALLEQSIAETFFENIFTAIMDTARRQRTASEVEKIESEKFMLLGPILENLIDDLLEPAVVRIYKICERRGLIGELPQELAGAPVNVAFVSILAQAQKALEAVGVEQTIAFAGSIAELWPRARHRVDIDDAIEKYAEATGGQEVIRSRADADELEEAEQQAIAAQQQVEQLAQAAAAAKDAAAADLEDDSALSRVAQQFTPRAA